MIVSTDNVAVTMGHEDVKQFGRIISESRPDVICVAATRALRHIVSLCSGTCPECPVMTDSHVFMANKIQEDEGAAIDQKRVQVLLEAWTQAEASLHPDARKAVRLVAPLCSMVLNAKDKKAFEVQFGQDILPRLDRGYRQSKAASYLRTYIAIVQDWLEKMVQYPSANAHYLENMVFHAYSTIVRPGLDDNGPSYVKKRLDAAQGALDSYLFE